MRPDGLDAACTLARHLRDPDAAAPAGVEEQRLRIYRDLFLNNLQSLLAGNFPVLHRILDEAGWAGLVADFYREHPARTPLFPELPREFLRYLEARAGQERGDAPWLLELAHYEWVELALQIHESAAPASAPVDEPLAVSPRLSPLAWPLAYAWPVHRLGPEFLPAAAPEVPTLLLVHRSADGRVRFTELSALSFRLLQRIASDPPATGGEHLRRLAAEAGVDADADFLAAGTAMLVRFHGDGVLVTARASAPVC